MKNASIGLAIILLILSTTGAAFAQTQVVVPGNASGYFGNAADKVVPLVPAITVSGPGTITVTYVSGTVYLGNGIPTGPNGIAYNIGGAQLPLQEAHGMAGGKITNFGALMGVF